MHGFAAAAEDDMPLHGYKIFLLVFFIFGFCCQDTFSECQVQMVDTWRFNRYECPIRGPAMVQPVTACETLVFAIDCLIVCDKTVNLLDCMTLYIPLSFLHLLLDFVILQ